MAGALCATAGVILPSFIIIILIVELLEGLGDSTWLTGALTGIKAAVVGLIGYSAYKVGRKVLTGAFPVMLAVLSFVAVALFGVNAVWMILVGIAAGLLFCRKPAESEGGRDEGDSL